MANVRTPSRRDVLAKLDRLIQNREPIIYVNLINCGTAGKEIISRLEGAGYRSDAPGSPQQSFLLQDWRGSHE